MKEHTSEIRFRSNYSPLFSALVAGTVKMSHFNI